LLVSFVSGRETGKFHAAGAYLLRGDAWSVYGLSVCADFAFSICSDGFACERLAVLFVFYRDRYHFESWIESASFEYLGESMVEAIGRS
jgi:hypothetical protein